MAEESAELRAAREAARRAREEAERLRQQARELEHRLRDEERKARHAEHNQAREERRREFDARRTRHQFSAKIDTPEPDGARVEQALDFSGITSLFLDQTAGKAIVRPLQEGEQPGVVVSANKTPPKVEIARAGDRMTVSVKLSTGWLFRRRQGATVILRMPQIDDVRVHLGAGEVDLRDIRATTINLDTGAGEIRTMATAGSLRANTGAGRISIQSHRGLCTCDSGTGDILMDIAETADGDYRGNVGMGRVEVRLPPGHQVNIRASSGIGKSRIEYPNGPETAPIKVRIETGIGEASVRARKPEAPGETPPAGQPKPQREGRSDAARRRREAEELRVLQMLEQGRISSQEAADLIAALQGANLDFEPDGDEPPPEADASAAPATDEPPPA